MACRPEPDRRHGRHRGRHGPRRGNPTATERGGGHVEFLTLVGSVPASPLRMGAPARRRPQTDRPAGWRHRERRVPRRSRRGRAPLPPRAGGPPHDTELELRVEYPHRPQGRWQRVHPGSGQAPGRPDGAGRAGCGSRRGHRGGEGRGPTNRRDDRAVGCCQPPADVGGHLDSRALPPVGSTSPPRISVERPSRSTCRARRCSQRSRWVPSPGPARTSRHCR